MADVSKIPKSELEEDLKFSLWDLHACEKLLKAGVTHYTTPDGVQHDLKQRRDHAVARVFVIQRELDRRIRLS
jgi:hypothetical protein